MRRPRRRGDDGAVLLFALIFIGVISLVLTSVVSLSTAGTRSVNITRQNLAKRYAADAALKYAIQQLRVKTELCDTPAALAPPSDLLTSNGGPFSTNTATPRVEVTCTPVSGGKFYGPAGYTLITYDTCTAATAGCSNNDGVTLSGAAGQTLPVDGPVFVSSRPAGQGSITITNGDALLYSTAASCPAQPSQIVVTTPFTYNCVNTKPAPSVTLPSTTFLAGMQPRTGPIAQLSTASCAVFLPGKYIGQALNVAQYPNAYFASGVYYFEDTDVIETTGSLFGGRPVSNDPAARLTTGAPCSSDAAVTNAVPPIANSGVDPATTGVKLILGGSSRFLGDNPGGVIELNSRDGGDETNEGTQGVSVMTVQPGNTNGLKASTLDYDTFGIGVANVSGNTVNGPTSCSRGGGGQTLSFGSYGLIYAPNACVKLRADSSEVQLRDGLVAGRLDISTSANISGFVLSVTATDSPRTLSVVASSCYLDPGKTTCAATTTDRTISASAKIQVNTSLGKAAISQWVSPL